MQDTIIERIQNSMFVKLSKDLAKLVIDWSWTVNVHSETFGGTIATAVDEDDNTIEGFNDTYGDFHPQGEKWYGRIVFTPPTNTEDAIEQLGEAVSLKLLIAGIKSNTQNTGEFVDQASGRQGHQHKLGYMGQSKTAQAKAKQDERMDKGAARIAKKMGISQEEALDMILGLNLYSE